MTKTMNHSNCPHPSTSSARAKCRKETRAKAANDLKALEETIAGYFDDSLDIEEIAARFVSLAPRAAIAYYNQDLDVEEVIGIARQYL